MKLELTTIWITDNSLQSGAIRRADARVIGSCANITGEARRFAIQLYRIDDNAFLTKEGAVNKMKMMQADRIIMLESEVARIRALRFDDAA